jgi:hypothetical protein
MSQSLQELRGRISDATAQVDAAMRQRTWKESQDRLHICRGTCGAHTEHM